MNLVLCATLHCKVHNAESLPDINMNKIKIFVPHQEKKKKKKNKEKREMHADRFFVYYQIGVALYLFTKD